MDLQSNQHQEGFLKRVFTGPMIVAVVILAISASMSLWLPGWLKVHMEKRTLPLKAPLSHLDVTRLGPYHVIQRQALPSAMVETLGTTSYISWFLEDTSLPPGDPLRQASLHVAYYSGRTLPLHRPGVCYIASGFTAARTEETVQIDVPSLGASGSSLPIRVASFIEPTATSDRTHTVVYTYHCNGTYMASHLSVRAETNSIGNAYAYFAKVELTFPAATRAQSIEGARKLYGYVLPILVRDHLPDFEAAEAAYKKTGEPA